MSYRYFTVLSIIVIVIVNSMFNQHHQQHKINTISNSEVYTGTLQAMWQMNGRHLSSLPRPSIVHPILRHLVTTVDDNEWINALMFLLRSHSGRNYPAISIHSPSCFCWHYSQPFQSSPLLSRKCAGEKGSLTGRGEGVLLVWVGLLWLPASKRASVCESLFFGWMDDLLLLTTCNDAVASLQLPTTSTQRISSLVLEWIKWLYDPVGKP